MARLEWNPIQAPNFAPVAATQSVASDLFSKAAAGATDTIKNYQTDIQNLANANLASQIARASTPEQLNNIQIDPNASMEAINAVGARRDALLKAASEAKTADTYAKYMDVLGQSKQADLDDALAGQQALQYYNNAPVNFNGQTHTFPGGIAAIANATGADPNAITQQVLSTSNLSPLAQAKVTELLRTRANEDATQDLNRQIKQEQLAQDTLTTEGKVRAFNTTDLTNQVKSISSDIPVYKSPTEALAVYNDRIDAIRKGIPESQLPEFDAIVEANRAAYGAAHKDKQNQALAEMRAGIDPAVQLLKANLSNNPAYAQGHMSSDEVAKVFNETFSDNLDNSEESNFFRDRVLQSIFLDIQNKGKTSDFAKLTTDRPTQVTEAQLTEAQKNILDSNVVRDPNLLTGKAIQLYSDSDQGVLNGLLDKSKDKLVDADKLDLGAVLERVDEVKSALKKRGYTTSRIPEGVYGAALRRGLKESGLTDDAIIDYIAKVDISPAVEFIVQNYDPNGKPSETAKAASQAYYNQKQASLNLFALQNQYVQLTDAMANRAAAGLDNTALAKRKKELEDIFTKSSQATTPKNNNPSNPNTINISPAAMQASQRNLSNMQQRREQQQQREDDRQIQQLQRLLDQSLSNQR